MFNSYNPGYGSLKMRTNQPQRGRRRASVRRNRDIASYSATAGFGPITTMLFLAVIVAVLSMLYLTQITKTSQYGYTVSELESQQTELVERQQELKAEAARLQTVARIESAEVTASLEEESDVSYAGPVQ